MLSLSDWNCFLVIFVPICGFCHLFDGKKEQTTPIPNLTLQSCKEDRRLWFGALVTTGSLGGETGFVFAHHRPPDRLEKNGLFAREKTGLIYESGMAFATEKSKFVN